MAALRDIKRRISSVRGTQQITRAMRMVAASKLRRAQDNLIKARPYTTQLQGLIANVARTTDTAHHPLLQSRPARTVCWIVVSGDRGLCGGFNSNILRAAVVSYRSTNDVEKFILPVGRKARDFFAKRDYRIITEYTNFFRALNYSHAQAIGAFVRERFLSGELDRIILVYNEFQTVLQQNIIVKPLLPLAAMETTETQETQESQETTIAEQTPEYLYEPEPDLLLNHLLPLDINMRIWRMLLESWAAELGARMAAMESATDAAEEMIGSLTLQYNKTRQQTITKELAEIVGGAEALK